MDIIMIIITIPFSVFIKELGRRINEANCRQQTLKRLLKEQEHRPEKCEKNMARI
jgi:hypothetical protein